MLRVISSRAADQKSKKAKVTCLTCNLKGCVGNCRFEVIHPPRPSNAL